MSIHPRLTAIHKQVLQTPAQKINIVLGELVPLDEFQLREQWLMLVKGTSHETAELHVRIVRAEQQCMVCFLKYHPPKNETACPQCKSVGAKILSGEEFYLELD